MPPSLLFQVKTAELDPSRSYLLGSHPHGVLCSGAVSAFATEGIFDQKLKRSLPASFLGPGWSELFPGLESHLLTLMIQFCIPGHRELVYWFVFSWQKLVCTGLSKSRTRICIYCFVQSRKHVYSGLSTYLWEICIYVWGIPDKLLPKSRCSSILMGQLHITPAGS